MLLAMCAFIDIVLLLGPKLVWPTSPFNVLLAFCDDQLATECIVSRHMCVTRAVSGPSLIYDQNIHRTALEALTFDTARLSVNE